MKDGRFDRLPIPLDPDDIDLDETAGSEPDDLPGGQALDLSVSPRRAAWPRRTPSSPRRPTGRSPAAPT